MQIKQLFGDDSNYDEKSFFLIAGPCVVENETMPLEIGRVLKDITDRLGIPFIFKASYRKANRSSISSFTGIGDEKALQVLAEVKRQLQVPVITDIHSRAEMGFINSSYSAVPKIAGSNSSPRMTPNRSAPAVVF